jgi:hypothetical protein
MNFDRHTSSIPSIPSIPVTPILGKPIKCLIKRGETFVTPQEIPDRDGWSNANIYGDDGEIVCTDKYKIYKSGTKLTVFHTPALGYILGRGWEFNCDLQSGEILNGRTTLQEAVISFIIGRCPDVEKIFMEIAPRLNSVDVSREEEILTKTATFKVNQSTSTPKKRPHVNMTDEKYVKSTKGFNDLVHFNERYMIVKGYIQSGKTQFIISAAVWFMMQGKHAVVVLRNNSDDEDQLKNRVFEFNRQLQLTLGEHAGKFEVVVQNGKLTLPKMKSCPKMIISIGNEAPLKCLNNFVETNNEMKKKYAVFIDEVDFVDSLHTKVQKQINLLRSNSYCVFGISATIMDTTFKEDVEKGNVIMLHRPNYYKGIENLQACNLKFEHKLATYTTDNILDIDPNMSTYLEKFATRDHNDTYYIPIYKEKHPIDTLIRVSTAILPNLLLLSHIHENYPNVVAMFYSGGGEITLSIHNQTEQIILSDGTRGKITPIIKQNVLISGKFYLFKNTSPSFVKEWLYNNGGVTKYPRIITLAGALASRSISFGAANYEECKNKNRIWWHLTEMYLCASKKMDQPELLQTAGRLCVVAKDSVSLKLYTTESVHEDLIKAYWVQEELIERATCIQNQKYIAQSIKNLPISDKKLSSRTLTKKVKYELNKVTQAEDRANGGWWEECDYLRRNADSDEIMTDEYEDCDTEPESEPEPDMDTITIPIEEYERLTKKMFPRWAKASSKISNFMHSLDPRKMYTQEEIRAELARHQIKNLNSVTHSIITTKRGYGQILYVSTCGYQLYPELRNDFKRFF